MFGGKRIGEPLQGTTPCPSALTCTLATAFFLMQLGVDRMKTPFDEGEFACFRFLPSLPQPIGRRRKVANS